MSLQYLKELGSKSLTICGSPFACKAMHGLSMGDSGFWHIPKLGQPLLKATGLGTKRQQCTRYPFQIYFYYIPTLVISSIGKIHQALVPGQQGRRCWKLSYVAAHLPSLVFLNTSGLYHSDQFKR